MVLLLETTVTSTMSYLTWYLGRYGVFSAKVDGMAWGVVGENEDR